MTGSRLPVGIFVVATVAAFAGSATLDSQRGAPPPAVVGHTQDAPVPGTGAISGVVIDGATERPLAGAVVSLGGGGRGNVPDPNRVTTDNQGRYVFARLHAAIWSSS